MPTTPEPVAVRVTRYRCPFCTRSRARKQATADHISRCWHNPAARSCKTCTHYQPAEPGPYPEHPEWPEACTAGRDIASGLPTGCPLWEEPLDMAAQTALEDGVHHRTRPHIDLLRGPHGTRLHPRRPGA